jgi:UPF0755 protein
VSRRTPVPRRNTRLLAAALGGLAVIAAAWFLLALFQPFAGEGEGEVGVVVPKGASIGEIGDVLEERGVVSSSFLFHLRARLSGHGGGLKPGSYRLKRDMSYSAAVDALVAGPSPEIVTLTIPEGRSRQEVARIVDGSLQGDYLAATRSSTLLDPARYKAPPEASLEGFLFPATYKLKRGRSVAALIEQQLGAFKLQFPKVDLRFATRKNLTRYDVLTIASMIEREAQLPSERRLVASVIYNRLHEGMPLGIDATIRFATGNWERPLTRAELASGSAYNTRTHRGLPPGPIGSPGLAAIEAAAKPARSRYLYYVVKPGTCPVEHSFSRTDAEFQRDVERYNRERERRGGKSPTGC